MGTAWYETAFGAHYPALYAHRDAAEAAAAVGLLAGLGVLAPPVLDLGCGDGRHLGPVAAAAGAVVGLDLSPALLAAARARDARQALVRADMRTIPCRDAAFGTVLSLFTAFGYFADDEQNARPVAEIGRVLRPGGTWCLDYLDADRVRAELADGEPRSRDRLLGHCRVHETRRLDRAAGAVRKRVLVRAVPGREADAAALGVGPAGLEYEERVRLFALAELDAMAASAGLRRIAARGGYRGEELGDGPRWILIYGRKDTP